MLIKRRETIATVNAIVDDPGAVIQAGVIALMVGVALVLGHNVWTGGAVPVVVTVVGWISAIKGVWLLATPSAILRKMFAAMHYERFFVAYMGVTLALGAYLIWGGLQP
jgi:hypothetical protein